jgi:hypothetical protein
MVIAARMGILIDLMGFTKVKGPLFLAFHEGYATTAIALLVSDANTPTGHAKG